MFRTWSPFHYLSYVFFFNWPIRARGNEYLGQKSSPAVGWCLLCIKANNSRSRSFHRIRIDGLSKAWACFCYVTHVPYPRLPRYLRLLPRRYFQLRFLSVRQNGGDRKHLTFTYDRREKRIVSFKEKVFQLKNIFICF